MNKHLLSVIAVLVCSLFLGVPVSAQNSITPSIGVSLGAGINMRVDNPDLSVQAGLEISYKSLLTTHQVALDTADIWTGADNQTSLSYDGNLLFERKKGSLAVGVGLNISAAYAPFLSGVVTRPYLAVARRSPGGSNFTILKAILPGNDGWRDQFGVQGQTSIRVLTVKKQQVFVTVTAGWFTYHATEGGMERGILMTPIRAYGAAGAVGVTIPF